jgi:hypothetical protein
MIAKDLHHERNSYVLETVLAFSCRVFWALHHVKRLKSPILEDLLSSYSEDSTIEYGLL